VPIAFVKREIPKGSIFLWHGTDDDIPIMFGVCDGTRNTPDLRDFFVPGAGITPNVGEIGGLVPHVHSFTTDGRLHFYKAGTDIAAGSGGQNRSLSDMDSGTTDAALAIPPYHSLTYIMYLGCKR